MSVDSQPRRGAREPRPLSRGLNGALPAKMIRRLIPLLIPLLACTERPPPAEEATASAAHSPIGVFPLQAIIFCHADGTMCGHDSRQALIDAWFLSVAEMNLQYQPTGISFQPRAPIIIEDERFSGMRGTGEETALNGEDNDALQAELIATFAAPNPQQITMFLSPHLTKCWNGIPCPGSDDGFDGDDVIFCLPPKKESASRGYVYSHEMGHYWCLRHTFSGADPSGPGSVDQDGDDETCATLTNVQDTPADPGEQGGDDVDDDGNPIDWHQWCETAKLEDVDYNSPHDSRCAIACYQRLPGVTVELSEFTPLARNAMSYYGNSCRGPYIIDGVRKEAFTNGQADQMAECRAVVPMRWLLSDACAGRGGDTDHDGWCNDTDRCAGKPTPTNGDADGDTIGDGCDACPFNATSLADNVNSDGDTWCDVHDRCSGIASSSNADSDGDTLGDACDKCPDDVDPTNLDTDSDGRGNVCDSDDDGDGCSDRTDQHPLQSSVVVGTQILPNCSPSSAVSYGSEAVDSDGDGKRNCSDTDDDNDGLLDEDDSCPLTSSDTCVSMGASCPLNPIFSTCRGGACNQQLLRVIAAVNPDPTISTLFDIVSIERDEILVAPLASRSIFDSAQAFRRPMGAVRLEIVDRRGRVIADVATYAPSNLRLGSMSGNRLVVTLPRGSAGPSVVAVSR